jgi:5-methylthioadenosine/S-adenosylhomocysteine deaminase
MVLLRGLADDLPLMNWLQNHIWPTETRWVNPDFVRDGARLAIAEMLRGGTTCFNDMYFFPEVTAAVARECGIRACVGLIALDFPTAYARNLDEYLSKGLALHEALKRRTAASCRLRPACALHGIGVGAGTDRSAGRSTGTSYPHPRS